MRATDESDNAIDQLISNLDKLPTMEFPSVGFNAQPIVIGGNDVFATRERVAPAGAGAGECWRRSDDGVATGSRTDPVSPHALCLALASIR
jgi:hypothetical protein